jgi:adenine-specific DNA-methyltransferase
MGGLVGQQIGDVSVSQITPTALLRTVEDFRASATRRLDASRRVELGQFLTPALIGKFMAEFCEASGVSLRVLDPGAGVGSLTASVIAELCTRQRHPVKVSVSAYELDPVLIDYLRQTMDLCRDLCALVGIQFDGQIKPVDFVQSAVSMVRSPLFEDAGSFDLAILNPPYRKISSDSDIRQVLRSAGIETSNLYTGFVSLVSRMLATGGEVVAITPRSFCNGPYFRPFREDFLTRMAFARIHIFGSRNAVFREDDVLQENIIFRAVRKPQSIKTVALSSSFGPGDESTLMRHVKPEEVVHPGDSELFIHIVPDEANHKVAERMATLDSTLADLGLSVSTGRVVDFRARRFLRSYPQPGCAPLIHPCHFQDGLVVWPKLNGKKPNAISINRETTDALVPSGVYVLTRRFSAKEEPRRVVAALYDPTRILGPLVGFENHLNYYHCDGLGLPRGVARGLVAFLNSTFVDVYFRQFNGHTQVNATDLRNLRYPSKAQLVALASKMRYPLREQAELDEIVDRELFGSPSKVCPLETATSGKVKGLPHEALR